MVLAIGNVLKWMFLVEQIRSAEKGMLKKLPDITSFFKLPLQLFF